MLHLDENIEDQPIKRDIHITWNASFNTEFLKTSNIKYDPKAFEHAYLGTFTWEHNKKK